ncbi:helix-turn-helix transcriptional regulator [Nitrobacter vulgaris]|uniref:helix-turn-helix transcriptional regulator n=1 Tax=Nitrobacter vulgaris TaxID=29421 RepID=UPI0035B4FCC2
MSKNSLSQRKAAAYLGISPSTLRAYVRAGVSPPYIELPGVRRFALSDLQIWLASRTVEGAQ